MKFVFLKNKVLLSVFTIFIFVFCSTPSNVYAVDSVKISLDEQEQLAGKLYNIMSNTDESKTDIFIKLHRQVIDQCPDTERAIESLWRLSNLYLFSMDPPDNQKVVELMEHLLKRYTDSRIVPAAKKRLLLAYEKIGNMKKVVELYDNAFKEHPEALEDPEMSGSILDYANALAATGNKIKARMLYKKIIGFGDKVEDWLSGIVRSKLEELDGRSN